MKRLLLIFVSALALGASAQELPQDTRNQPKVTIAAKGTDVRTVLTDLFGQAKKDFVLEPNIRFVLYLSLTEMPFEEALEIVCKTASLRYEVQNGIWFLSKKPTPKPIEPQPIAKPAEPKPAPPTSRLPASVLKTVVTTRFQRAPLAELMAEAAELRIALTVVAIDLDEFKAVNDVFGHAVGDRVLVWFAQRLAALVRQRDAVGRIGGEEFLLVLANTGRQGAERVLRELRSVLFNEPLPLQSSGLAVRFSAGIAEAQAGDTPEVVCQRADQGLYRAKAAGRAQDCFVPGPPDPVRPALRRGRAAR